MRFLRTRADTTALADVQDDEIRSGEAVYCWHKDAIVFVIGSLKGPPAWTNSDVPKQLGDEYYKRDLAALRIGVHAALPPTDMPASFHAAVDSRRTPGQSLVFQGETVRAFYIFADEVAEAAVIPAQPEARRTDAIFDGLKDKKVGLVGCGSLGGKIGAMMTRAGVGKWLLVDDDLLMPDNFVRNELDWRDAGSHKASVFARRMEINPAVILMCGRPSSERRQLLNWPIPSCDCWARAT